MATLRSRLQLFCMLLSLGIPAVAQVTITAGDVASKLAPGNSITTHEDTTTASVNIGAPGASSWDFSGLLSQGSMVLTSVDPSGTPYAVDFPGATHAVKTDTTLYYTNIRIAGTLYQYYTLGQNGLLSLGVGGGGLAYLQEVPPITLAVTLKMKNYPADTTYALPSTMNTSWGSTYVDTTTITSALLSPAPFGTPHSARFTVDAYGSMTIPGGSVHQALRIREEAAGPVISYIFLSPDGASVSLDANDPASPDNGVIAVNSISWTGPVPTSVATTRGIPLEFSLQQNYPNPFNPATVLRYALPVQTHVSLTVYNAIGQNVATLVNGELAAGEHEARFDGTGFASGLYFYRLQAGSFVATKKMMLVK